MSSPASNSNGPHLLRLEDVHKNFSMGEVEVAALRGVSLAVEDGELLAMLGPSEIGRASCRERV